MAISLGVPVLGQEINEGKNVAKDQTIKPVTPAKKRPTWLPVITHGMAILIGVVAMLAARNVTLSQAQDAELARLTNEMDAINRKLIDQQSRDEAIKLQVMELERLINSQK